MVVSIQTLTLWKILGIALIVSAYAATIAKCASYVVVPNGLEEVEGNSRNLIPFFSNPSIFEYQQIYDASQFDYDGPNLITEIAFRADVTTPDISQELLLEIDLSTTVTNSTEISQNLAVNRGSEVVTSFAGSLRFDAVENALSGYPQDFQALIKLDTPYAFAPQAGNLLMEIRRPAPVPQIASGSMFLDAVFQTEGVGRLFRYDSQPPNLGGAYSGQGLVTRFTIVPEPPNWILAVIATICWSKLWWRYLTPAASLTK